MCAFFAQRRFAVAPMMDWTDTYCRRFHRMLTTQAFLYTEMLTAKAVIHGNRNHLLGFSPAEHPLGLQLGGSEPGELTKAAKIGEDFGYDEINLNVGCPSDRVQSGRFGACLMLEPARVAECVATLKAQLSIPVTVKCRLGVDDQDTEESLDYFVGQLVAAGVDGLWVHARKAWLKGLSPRENRTVPPLDHARVRRLKACFPHIFIGLNGGITTLAEAEAARDGVDGVMLGRAAYQTPALLAGVDRLFYDANSPSIALLAAAEAMRPFMAEHLSQGGRLNAITRHMLGLFQGKHGARQWRRLLTEGASRPGADLSVFDAALAAVRGEIAARDAA